MRSKYPLVPIGDVCAVGDGAHSKVDRTERGVPYLTSKNIGQGVLKLDKLDFISELSYEKLFPKNSKATRRPKGGDILIGIIGTFGNAYLYKDSDYFGFSSSIGILRPNADLITPRFLYYAITSEYFKNNHESHNAGSVQGYTNIPTVKSLLVPLPPIEYQAKIADVLESLDQKIHLNTQTNQTLEAIAQAIFKSWFVDFDPVKAKRAVLAEGGSREQAELAAMCAISGKSATELAHLQHQNPDQYRQLAETAALFPSAMVESELGEIPEGWEVGPIGSLVESTIGGDWGKDEADEKHQVKAKIIRGTDMPNIMSCNDMAVPLRFVQEKKLKGRSLQFGDVVIEVSGGSPTQPTGRSIFISRQILERMEYPVVPASFCRLLRPKTLGLGFFIGIYMQIIYAEGKTWLYQNQSTGISNFQTTVFLEKELLAIPRDVLIDRFLKVTSPIIERVHSSENLKLANLRDTLLPKLLSGEIDLTKLQSEVA